MKKASTGKKSAQPNQLLRAARENKGLSQKEVADALGLLDARSIRRWERGTSFPQPYYRRKLCELFGQSLEELGLLPPNSLNLQHAEESPPHDPANTSMPTDTQTHTWNIPSWFTSFIGRTTEVASIRSLLARPEVRLVTLLGPGGVGKTRLAVEMASRSQADFPGGVCLVSFAAIPDPALVLPTIAKELQIQENGKQAFIETLQRFFGSKQFLLILDNFEHVLAAGGFIEQLLAACPGLKVLVTSRIVLHLQAEHEFALDPFPSPEQNVPTDQLLDYHAIQLFVQRARARLATFAVTPESLSLISKICACLDGLPLAIELAAAQVKLFRLPALWQEISQQRLSLLKSERKTEHTRHQTLTNTIKWSYHLLNEQEQWFFRHLTVFPGGCSLLAARKLGQISQFQGFDVLDNLMSLLDKNMIRPGRQVGDMPFFSMLETIREYGISALQETGEWETARQMQADYALNMLEEAERALKGVQQGEWLIRLDDERENLRAALNWLIERRESAKALAFCEVFGKYCGLRGYWHEELHWLENTLALAQTGTTTRLRGRVLRRAGYILYRFRDLARADTLLTESAALSEMCDDLSNLAGAYCGLAWVHYHQDMLAEAGDFFHKSVIIARRSGDNWSLANALEGLGRFIYSQGNLREAALYVEESIALARVIEDRESLARQLSAFVPIKIAQEQFEAAEAFAQESFSFALALGNKPLIGIALTGLADTAYAQNNFARAIDLYEQRTRLASELDDKPTISHIKLKLSQIALKQQNFERASTLAQESLTFFQDLGDIPNITLASRILAESKQPR